jgi:hypothetical protein
MAAGTPKSFSVGTSPATVTSPKKGVATLITINSTQSECDLFDFTGYRTMAIKPSASVTTITFYGSETSTGTYVLIDSLGTNGVVTVVASKWNVIDATKIAPFSYLQMKSDQAAATASILAST